MLGSELKKNTLQKNGPKMGENGKIKMKILNLCSTYYSMELPRIEKPNSVYQSTFRNSIYF